MVSVTGSAINATRRTCRTVRRTVCAKAGATIAAENGVTDRQLIALYDWTTSQLADVYTKRADKKKLEAAKLIGDQVVNTDCPTAIALPNNSTEKAIS